MTEQRLSPKWVNAARLVVKYKPIVNRYGVNCSNPFEANNRKVWPAERGEVTQDTIHGNGWVETVLVAHFSNGRSITFARRLLTEAGKLEWFFMYGFDPKEFKVEGRREEP